MVGATEVDSDVIVNIPMLVSVTQWTEWSSSLKRLSFVDTHAVNLMQNTRVFVGFLARTIGMKISKAARKWKWQYESEWTDITFQDKHAN